jgi:ribonucleoside-diphosphate reductase alpha chain
MAARSRLPDRRESERFEFVHGGVRYMVDVGRYGHGPIGEVFMDANKVGTAIQVYGRDSAILLSLLLQHGCAMDTIRHALTRNPDGSAAGPIGTLLDLLSGPHGERLRKPANEGDAT